MSETTEPAVTSPETPLNLNKPEAWGEIHQRTEIFNYRSSLVLIRASLENMHQLIAASQILVNFDLNNEEMEKRFEISSLLFPPGSDADLLRSNVMSEIQGLLTSRGSSAIFTKMVPWLCKSSALINNESENLISAVRSSPRNSVCTIVLGDLYRYAVLESSGEDSHRAPLEAIAKKHLEQLLHELADIANSRDVVFVIFCDEHFLSGGELTGPDHITFVSIQDAGSQHTETATCDEKLFAPSFRTGGWPSVMQHPNFLETSKPQLAAALFEYFGEANEPKLAWNAIRPIVESGWEFSASSQLAISAAAYVSGDSQSSEKLLTSSVDAGFRTPEEYFAALSLADSLKDEKAFESSLQALCRLFPNSRLRHRGDYLSYFRKRQFSKALEIALKLAMPIEIAQCGAFITSNIAAGNFLSEMGKLGDLEQGLLSCAEEAMFRKHVCQAICWAKQIPSTSRHYERACEVRFHALRIAFKRGSPRFCERELEALMRLVATQPKNLALRGELERLLEHYLEEPLVVSTLTNLLEELLHRQALRDNESLKAAETLRLSRISDTRQITEEQFELFCDGLQTSILSGPLVYLGTGTIDVSVQHLISHRMLNRLIADIDPTNIDNFEEAALGIHAVCLTADATNDPSAAYSLLQTFIGHLSSLGFAQELRNLSEVSLQWWPDSQSDFLSWRISLGWGALAESCLRTKNIVASLRFQCLSLLAHEAAAHDLELLRQIYRRAARIQRDLKIFPLLAVSYIGLEKSLLIKINAFEDMAVSLDVFKFQVMLPTILSQPVNFRLEALARCEDLFSQQQGGEFLPLMAIQSSLLRSLPRISETLQFRTNFQKNLEAVPPFLRKSFESSMISNPTVADIKAIIESLPNAQDQRYLAYQMTNSMPAFLNALSFSVESGDPELFLIASGAFTQPGISAEATDPASLGDSTEPRQSLIRTMSLEGFEAGHLDPTERYSFNHLANISLAQLRFALGLKEIALILVGERSSKPSFMLVSNIANSIPKTMADWSIEMWGSWKSALRGKLFWSEPKSYLPGIDILDPPVEKVRIAFEGLSLSLDSVPEHLTLIPPPHLFGFPWQLSLNGGAFLIESTSLAIAPSAAWLISARKTPWAGKAERRAWIGSSDSKDGTLHALRDRLSYCLQNHNISLSSESAPWNFAGTEIALIGAHGHTGMMGHFNNITDRVYSFSPTEFAQMFTGCGCVVLAVCSGGVSNKQAGSEETLGLVTALLGVGVRCVIAPPWPLDIEVMTRWLPAFLTSMDGKGTVGEAAKIVQYELKAKIDHPCAWGQLHVYGDQNFRCPTAITTSKAP